jgi:hypothetical protein
VGLSLKNKNFVLMSLLGFLISSTTSMAQQSLDLTIKDHQSGIRIKGTLSYSDNPQFKVGSSIAQFAGMVLDPFFVIGAAAGNQISAKLIPRYKAEFRSNRPIPSKLPIEAFLHSRYFQDFIANHQVRLVDFPGSTEELSTYQLAHIAGLEVTFEDMTLLSRRPKMQPTFSLVRGNPVEPIVLEDLRKGKNHIELVEDHIRQNVVALLQLEHGPTLPVIVLRHLDGVMEYVFVSEVLEIVESRRKTLTVFSAVEGAFIFTRQPVTDLVGHHDITELFHVSIDGDKLKTVRDVRFSQSYTDPRALLQVIRNHLNSNLGNISLAIDYNRQGTNGCMPVFNY